MSIGRRPYGKACCRRWVRWKATHLELVVGWLGGKCWMMTSSRSRTSPARALSSTPFRGWRANHSSPAAGKNCTRKLSARPASSAGLETPAPLNCVPDCQKGPNLLVNTCASGADDFLTPPAEQDSYLGTTLAFKRDFTRGQQNGYEFKRYGSIPWLVRVAGKSSSYPSARNQLDIRHGARISRGRS